MPIGETIASKGVALKRTNLYSKFFSLLLLISLSLPVLGKISPLTKLKRSDSSEVTTLSLVINELGEIKKLIIKTPEETSSIKPRHLKGKGTAILKQMGVKVIVLKSSNFDKKLGGIIVLDYLVKYRLIGKNKRAIKEIELVKDKNDKWILLNKGIQFKSIFFKVGNKGIKRVTFN